MSTRATVPGAEKARITRLDENLKPVDENEVVVAFNPTEISVDKSVTYAEQDIPGLDSPIQQFVQGGAETLSMELFFDSYELHEDVRDQTMPINELLFVDSERHAPPIVKFAWGSISFTSIVESANTTYTMFRRDGTPVRARIDLSFREYTPPEKQLQGTPRHSADRTSVYRVTEGDTLWGIAGKEYGRPGAWRHIARVNDIENPRRLQPGDELLIPILERS